MEKSLTRYIWAHTRRQQIWVLAIVLLSMIPYYLAFDLPKQIVNGPIQGKGFTTPGETQIFMRWTPDLPFIGQVELFPGIPLDRLETLGALSACFLALVIVNGIFKYYINTYKGRLGERLLRRIRYELIDILLRFPPTQFRRMKAAEAASMIKDEVEPMGGFTGEAFVQPVMLGGQALAALVFIFAQNLWLGSVAGVIAAIQVILIPRMRRRLLVLGRERQLTARQLSGRVNEIVDGISTVHALDTTNYERADISRRLGTIFRIRYDLYQWKFMVKFVNNFLAQVTPFIFYLFGGYLTIRGTLDVGQLVAVINAYKDLPDPLKELIDWDQSRQDVEVKYEQVVGQFRVPQLIPASVHEMIPGAPRQSGRIEAQGLVIEDEGGNRLLDGVSLTIGRGEKVALVDDHGAGAEALASAIGRAVWPTSGRLSLGKTPILDLPEAVTGRCISYVPTEGYFFVGSILDNLLYGLRHAPERPAERDAQGKQQYQWVLKEAKAAGNAAYDIDADWLDRDTVPMNAKGERSLADALLAAIAATDLEDDIFDFGLLRRFDPLEKPQLAAKVIEIRHRLRADLDAGRVKARFIPFDPARYNEEASIFENLLFGVLEDPRRQGERIIRDPHVWDALDRLGLATQLFDLGLAMAHTITELLGDEADEEMVLGVLPFLSAEDLTRLRQIPKRWQPGDYARAEENDRLWLIRLSMSYVEPVQRFGLLTPELSALIVRARGEIRRNMPEELAKLVEVYDPDRYMRSVSLLENILFGKVRDGNPGIRREIRDAVLHTLEEAGMKRTLLRFGLEHNVGVGGRRLSTAQRQKLNVARVLIRDSDYYVFNKPLSAIDSRQQEAVTCRVLDLLAAREGTAVIWVLTNMRMAHLFGRVVVFERGSVREDGRGDRAAVQDKAAGTDDRVFI